MFLRKSVYYLSSIINLITGIREWPLVVKIFMGFIPEGSHLISLRRSGLRFRVRGKMDIWSLKETFLDRFYERFGMPIGDEWIILDVGAGIGDFTLFATYDHPQNTVYAFEPFPPSCEYLRENLRLNAIVNAVVFNNAVSRTTGEILLDFSGGEPLQVRSYHPSPIMDKQQNRSKAAEGVAVSSVSLADIFSSLGLTHCHLLKLDCEGSEFEILFNASAELLDCVERMVLEYHDGLIPHRHRELVSYLQARGFRVETFKNNVHPDLGYMRAWKAQGLHAIPG